MDQRKMEKEIWAWLYGFALNIAESPAFIESLEDEYFEDRQFRPRKIPGSRRFRETLLTETEYLRLERAGKRVAEIIDRKAGD